MGLETFGFITNLVATNPTGGDPKGQGDDHLRGLKQTLLNSFPTVSRAFNLKRWSEKEAEVIETNVDRAMVTNDDGRLIYFDCSAGARVFTLLAVGSAPQGMIVFLDRDATVANALTITPSGGDLVNALASDTLLAGESGILYKTNTAWRLFKARSNRDYLKSFKMTGAGLSMTLEDTTNDATEKTSLILSRTRTGVANDILQGIRMRGKDASNNVLDLVALIDEWVGVTAGNDGSRLRIRTRGSGANRDWLLEAGALRYSTLNQPASGGAINATDLQVNNQSIANTVIQTSITKFSTYDTSTTNIPADDTIPQITEGKQLFSVSFTPKSAASTIVVSVEIPHFQFTTGALRNAVVAVFKDAGPSALAVGVSANGNAGNPTGSLRVLHSEASGSTAARTYSARYGTDTATMAINGDISGRNYGGACACIMMIEERL